MTQTEEAKEEENCPSSSDSDDKPNTTMDPDADDTASASTGGAFDTSSLDESPPMPILKYTRISGLSRTTPTPASESTSTINGISPQPLSTPCSCSSLAQVLLSPWNETGGESHLASTNAPPANNHEDPQQILRSDLWTQQPFFVMAAGFDTGKVSLLSVANGQPVVSQPQLSVREELSRNGAPPVVAVSFDSSGTVLSAIDAGGTCAVWELKYYPTWTRSQRSSAPTAPSTSTATTTASSETNPAQTENMFSSFMSALTGMPPPPSENFTTRTGSASTDTNSPTSNANTANNEPLRLSLAANIQQAARVTYPNNWKSPTCMALDPAYKRKREKSFCVGFSDGRLLLTKRGGLFQRRNDTVLFQGSPSSSLSENKGIECITWRASLLAWADASGIKLMDIDTLTRIAHIDRPTGARPTLYPTIASFQPHLYFETSKSLLVAWGDCLMTMQIKEVPPTTPSVATASDEKPRRNVECTMAWELEGVACGVVPMDADHVGILALVTPEEDDDEDDAGIDGQTNNNDLEMQILSRTDGNILYCDSLPLVRSSIASTHEDSASLRPIESAAQYMMLSTFALPRMDDTSELEEFNMWTLNNPAAAADALEEFDMSALFSAGGNRDSNKPTFVDTHAKWSIQSVLFEDNYDETRTEQSMEGSDQHNDTGSVDSDDYAFALRPIVDESILQAGPLPSPPLMIISSGSDMVMARMTDIDDAVSHALRQLKPAMALSRGLRHRRQLRRYQIGDLVDNYLQAILKISPPKRQLSLRRMNMAVQAMPVLLGGHTELWEKWSKELETIPGSLFLLRNQLPVRDPILPSDVYERVLQKMFVEVDQMMQPSQSQIHSERLVLEAGKDYLDSLLAWGPTNVLKEHIKLYKYGREKYSDESYNNSLKPVELALQRRYLQTAAGYLNFPVNQEEEDAVEATAPRYEAHKDDSQDSLFRVDEVLESLIPLAPMAALPQELLKTESSSVLNNQISLDAVARLRMMQNRYDLALKAFLTIGALHSTTSMQQIESSAVNYVNGIPDDDDQPILVGSFSYSFVLGIIEFHHLHQLLLDDDFILRRPDGSVIPPLFALIRMVGLPLMGNFLIEHCVSPDFSSSDQQYDREPIRKETLPLDDVAEQLEKSPALLHWYLHLVFTKKPELYIKFPNNAIPPKAVTELHRNHFKLHVRFAGDARDSAKSLAGTDVYKVEAKTTPLLSFLKATLALGGVLPVDARRELEIQRSEGADELSDDSEGENEAGYKSSCFSLELAYIIENYSEHTEAEAMGVLDLYLEGANSLMLAVSYAQRASQFSSALWDKLIMYCLPKSEKGSETADGMLFGALLEAAALSGANLARLVSKIPPGMVVEGLRPRLVAAVADYRFKLDIHQAAASAAAQERVTLLREVSHRSRRGVRYSLPSQPKIKKPDSLEESKIETEQKPENLVLSRGIKIVERRGHHRLAFSIPMR